MGFFWDGSGPLGSRAGSLPTHVVATLMVHLGAARAGALVDDFELKFCFAVGFSAALGRKSLSDGRSSPAGQKNSTDSRSRSDCRHRNESSVGSYPAARRAFSMRSYSAVSPSTMATLRQRSRSVDPGGHNKNPVPHISLDACSPEACIPPAGWVSSSILVSTRVSIKSL